MPLIRKERKRKEAEGEAQEERGRHGRQRGPEPLQRIRQDL